MAWVRVFRYKNGDTRKEIEPYKPNKPANYSGYDEVYRDTHFVLWVVRHTGASITHQFWVKQ